MLCLPLSREGKIQFANWETGRVPLFGAENTLPKICDRFEERWKKYNSSLSLALSISKDTGKGSFESLVPSSFLLSPSYFFFAFKKNP